MRNNLELDNVYRKIPSLNFLYEVNCDGTRIRNSKSKKCLKCFKAHHNSDTEYWCTQINIKGKIKKIKIHQVVAECWLGPKPKGLEIDHIDKNSLNNHYTNLRYVTKSEQNRNKNHDKFMHIIEKNLSVVLQPLILRNKNEAIYFRSLRQASYFLEKEYPDKSYRHFLSKLTKRKKHIFDYSVIYLSNAETGHGYQDMGKEQSKIFIVSQ